MLSRSVGAFFVKNEQLWVFLDLVDDSHMGFPYIKTNTKLYSATKKFDSGLGVFVNELREFLQTFCLAFKA